MQYIPYLRDYGIDVLTSPLFGDQYLIKLYSNNYRSRSEVTLAYLKRLLAVFRFSKYDLLWIEKELFPWIPAWLEKFLTVSKIPYILDYDDAIFHNYDLNPNRLVKLLLRNKIKNIMQNAAMVVVGNEYLANYARKANAARVEVLPTVVDLVHYRVQRKKEDEMFTIGWIGTPSTAKYLSIIGEALEVVSNGRPVRLVLIGSGEVKFAKLKPEIRPWSELTEVNDLGYLDVGIMPLKDDNWERGKCGYKLIQYMACGLPVIASPVGVNPQIVEHNLNGFIAVTDADWINAFKALINDPELKKKMGNTGRAKVEKEYSVQSTTPKLASLLFDAAKRQI